MLAKLSQPAVPHITRITILSLIHMVVESVVQNFVLICCQSLPSRAKKTLLANLALNLHVNNHSCQNPNGIKFFDKLL